MTLLDAYRIAEEKQIRVFYFPLNGNSVALPCGAIGIDPSAPDEKFALMHEIGHCVTGAFYTAHTSKDTVRKCEAQATRWALKRMIPKSELDKLLSDRGGEGLEAWEVAEHFGVTEELALKAIRMYCD